MAMTPYSGDTSIIGKLGTTPQERGLTTQQFKDKFDEGLKEFVTWFNSTHKTEFDAHLAESVTDADGAHGLIIEEGTFTPTVIGSSVAGTQTYSSAWGQYKKIDNMVYFQLYVTLSAKDAAMAGNVQIGGLPFTPATKSLGVRGVSIGRAVGIDTTKTGVLSVNGAIVSNAPFIAMYFIVDGATSIVQEYLKVSEIINTFSIGISGFYEV